ncbi:MAG: hypothetical protein HPY75_09490 [Actinobacteria bacterium]|nr:hypothetical protein [Actinomycetota bacterium]
MELNRLAEDLRSLCSSRPLEEKRLLAPSLRVGRQWLDAVTCAGTAVFNVRIMTVTGFALELAAPEMERRGLTFAGDTRLGLVLEEMLAQRREEAGYLGRLDQSPGLARMMASSFRDLRLAGVTAEDLHPKHFEVSAKGEELASLFAAYDERLRSLSLADLSAVLRIAERRLREDARALPPQCLVALPSDMLEEISALERALWDALPEGVKVILECDRPCEARVGAPTDAALLAWLPKPAEAPMPAGDGSVDFFRAEGEVNEVREVFRRCVASGIPLDEVEVLHSDYSTYVPLIYEVCRALFGDGDDVPVTFAEGIPVSYSRPGRALAGWISWVRDGYPQETIARMIEDGLLKAGDGEAVGGFARLAAALRALPIGAGRDRYLHVIRGALDSLSAGPPENGDEDVDASEGAEVTEREPLLESLASLIENLTAELPRDIAKGVELLAAAEDFLSDRVRCTSEFDEYARRRLLKGVREISACLEECGADHIDIQGRLSEMAASLRVEGKSPKPGCLHVAPLLGGGHSGRPHVFILGLDDGRFPGAGLQDPLLLDSEREAISRDLPTSAGRQASVMEGLARVMSRLRAKVTIAYCCRDLTEDREMFPSQAVLSAYRVTSGVRDAVQDDLLRKLEIPESFVPRRPEKCLDEAEWWINRLCGEAPVANAEEAVFAAYPHLGYGRKARLAREGEQFTEYDGYVPEVGAELDPARPDGPVLSASQLQTLAKCPLEYFLTYVLGISPPEEYVPDPYRWLDTSEKGSVLHAVFRDFHRRLMEEGRTPCLESDWETLRGMVEERLALWERLKPAPNPETARLEREDMLRCARIFLAEEERYCRLNRPLYLELAVGMAGVGAGNPADSPDPVCVELPGGRRIRVRGRIDRVDEIGERGSEVFSILDYKIGSAYGYDIADPFKGGRRVQHYLYLVMAEQALASRHPRGRVVSFQYFFPSTREHGERLTWDADSLREGPRFLACLSEMLATGCFPFTDSEDDVRYSDYLPAFGDVKAAAARSRARLEKPGDDALSPFRRLRGYTSEGAD